MRIIEEEQLEFDDVSIQPKRSTLNSRSEVDIWRTFKWTSAAGNKHELTCKPIISAIMTTVGTPKMAYELVTRGYLASIEKHIAFNEIDLLYNKLEIEAKDLDKDPHFYTDKICLCVGLNDSLDIIKEVMKYHKVNVVHVDCPNAYIPKLKERVKEVRELLPEAFMIAGVVVTSDLTTDLVNMGVNCVSMGINSGCFTGDMKVLTDKGLVPIKDINIGQKVLTHTGEYKPITNKFMYNSHKEVININGIECTPNHKFYVAKIEDIDKITETNYKQYCFWIEAKDLDSTKYKLIKIK